jgi:ectoine hydroxylase-related dioxygenase (phytanoyl-CoA dioxygenase family)
VKEGLDDVLHDRVQWPACCFQHLDPKLYLAPSGDPMPEGIQQPSAQDPRFQQIADHPRLVTVMRDLIGPEVIRYTDQVILKTPGISPATFFHQDGFYWRNTPEKTVNCWIALDDAGVANGCLCFLPGSHRDGLVDHEAYFDEPVLHHGQTGRPFQRLRVPLDRVDFAAEVAEPVPAGGCLLFKKYTWHRSDPNRSAEQRRAYAIAYHEAV